MTPLTKNAFINAIKAQCITFCIDNKKPSPVVILDSLPAIMAGLKAQMLTDHGIQIYDDAPIDSALLSITKDNRGRGKGYMDIVIMLHRERIWRISKKELDTRNIDAIIRKGKLAEVAKVIHRIITTES